MRRNRVYKIRAGSVIERCCGKRLRRWMRLVTSHFKGWNACWWRLGLRGKGGGLGCGEKWRQRLLGRL